MTNTRTMEYIINLYELENKSKTLDSYGSIYEALETILPPLTCYKIKRWLDREQKMSEKQYTCEEEQLNKLSEYITSIVNDENNLLNEHFTLAINNNYQGVISYSSFNSGEEERDAESKKDIAYSLIRVAFRVFTLQNLKTKDEKININKINQAIKTIKDYDNNQHLHYYLDEILPQEGKIKYNNKHVESSYFYSYASAVRGTWSKKYTNKERAKIANEFLAGVHGINKSNVINPQSIEYYFHGIRLLRYKSSQNFNKRYMKHALNNLEKFIKDFDKNYN